jgi:hypothetical protein
VVEVASWAGLNADLSWLLVRASTGDSAAFGRVIDLTSRQASTLVSAMGCESPDRVLERCYREVWDRLDHFGAQDLSAPAWVIGIVYELALRHPRTAAPEA